MLVLDNSRSYYSRELISHFANSPWFNSVAVVDTPEQLKQSIDIQKQAWLWKYLLILPYL